MSTFARWGVVYQLIVCGEHGNCFVHWDFARTGVRTDERTGRASATALISVRALSGLANGSGGWEAACHSGDWRFFQSVAAVAPDGYARPPSGGIEDILRLRYPYEGCLERFLSAEAERWRGSALSSQP